jgi:hypothetical protein
VKRRVQTLISKRVGAELDAAAKRLNETPSKILRYALEHWLMIEKAEYENERSEARRMRALRKAR